MTALVDDEPGLPDKCPVLVPTNVLMTICKSRKEGGGSLEMEVCSSHGTDDHRPPPLAAGTTIPLFPCPLQIFLVYLDVITFTLPTTCATLTRTQNIRERQSIPKLEARQEAAQT